MLSVFVAKDRAGLTVNRQAIANYDEKASKSMRIGRKTDEQLKKVTAGGKIILMFNDCRGGKGKMVIATSKTGDNYNGCWYYFTDMVHIVWEDGRTSSFEPNDFTVKDDK